MPENERKIIKVASVATPRKVGKFEVLEFKGEDGVKYEVWAKTLATEVKQGAELDCDITHSEKESESGGVFFHHKVTQIYKDGKPITEAKGGKGQFTQDSPQKIASIEAQTAYNGLIQLIIADKLNLNEGVGEIAIDWAIQRLKIGYPKTTQLLTGKADVIIKEIKKVLRDEITTEASSTKIEQPKAASEPILKKETPQNVQELMSWITSHGKKYTPSWACQQLGEKAPTGIVNIQQAYLDLKALTGWEI